MKVIDTDLVPLSDATSGYVYWRKTAIITTYMTQVPDDPRDYFSPPGCCVNIAAIGRGVSCVKVVKEKDKNNSYISILESPYSLDEIIRNVGNLIETAEFVVKSLEPAFYIDPIGVFYK